MEEPRRFHLENAPPRRSAWYKLLDAPVLTLDVTVYGDRSRREPNQPASTGCFEFGVLG
jgi:hypothetical protein